MAYPNVYPTGTTIYDPEKCWNGYTIFQASKIDVKYRVNY